MSALFTPYSLRSLVVPNRIAISPMCQYSSVEGEANDWHLIHLGHLALSGAGMLCIEATAVEPDGRITPGCLGLWDQRTEAALQPVMAAVRRYSGIAMAMQLAHAGRKASCRVPWQGGGFIAVPGAGATATFTGGTGGTTDSPTFVTFPQNGATNGAAGDLALLAAAAQPAMCIAADLSVTVTDGVIGVTAGTNVTFTITVHNNGPNPVAGASLSDPFGAAFTGETWTCTGVACPAAAGTGSLSEVLGALPSGAQATFTVVASVSPTATSPLTNTATVAPPSGIVDGTPANNTATTSNALDAASADIGVALTSVSSSVLAAAAYSYAVEVTNAGPSVASGVAATVTLPAGATLGPLPATDATEGWTCAAPVGPSVTCSHVTLLGASESTTLTLDVTAPSLLSASTATLTLWGSPLHNANRTRL